MSSAIDHLLICCADLGTAHDRFLELGLRSVEGGRHPGMGTANRIIPLGSTYIELVEVVDSSEAADTSFGRWVLDNRDGPDRIHGLCVRVGDIDAEARRLGWDVAERSRVKPDGSSLAWKLAGTESMERSGTPFIITWDIPIDQHPSATQVDHPCGEVELASLTVSGSEVTESLVDGIPEVVFLHGESGYSAEIGCGSGGISL